MEKYLGKLELKYNKIVQDLNHEIYIKHELMSQKDEKCACKDNHDQEMKANFKIWASEKRDLTNQV